MTQTVVILDTEFTTWEGAMENDWSEDWQHRELVQIAAAKVNVETLEIVDTFDRIIKPVINPELSDMFIDLTGITNEDVAEKGDDFKTVFEDFMRFIDGDNGYCYGWDGRVFEENLDLNDMPDRKGEVQFDTLHPYFASNGVDVSKVNSGRLSKHFGLPLEVNEHYAMDDVLSIHASIKHLKEQGKGTPFDALLKAA